MSGRKKLETAVNAYTERLAKGGEAIAREAAEIGAKVMRQAINTSGTGWEGREARRDTSAMYRSVSSAKSAVRGTARTGSKRASYRFGYIRGRAEDYFHYQDEGFRNINKKNSSADGAPAGYTMGTFALASGWYAAREYMRRALKKK